MVPARSEFSYDVADLQPGKEIVVHYNPANPDDAVLDTRAHPNLARVRGAAAVLLLFAPPSYMAEHYYPAFRGLPFDAFYLAGIALALYWFRRQS